MSPTLEMTLAKLADYMERRCFGTGAQKAERDSVGLEHLLNDPELSAWLDRKRKEGIPPGPMIYKRAY